VDVETGIWEDEEYAVGAGLPLYVIVMVFVI
jgi:hypothetical protein